MSTPQDLTALLTLRAAMQQRDAVAAEAARLAGEETQLAEAIEVARQEQTIAFQEAEAQAVLFEDARAALEEPTEEARRHWTAAQTAHDTAAREARLVAEGLTRMEQQLADIQHCRGEIRREQAASHEAFEKAARAVRIFTEEDLNKALEIAKQTKTGSGIPD